MRIAYGFYTADEGEILLDGEVRSINTPHDAIALGIAARTPFVEERDRPQRTPRVAPADVVQAELHTLRLLRQEAQRGAIGPLGTPSGAFGNQPA